MRVVIESERTLVVEAPGRYARIIFFFVAIPLIILHAFYLKSHFTSMLAHRETGFAYTLLAVSVFFYLLVIYLFHGPLRDKITITFHGLKMLVILEYAFAFGYKIVREIPFKDIKQFEISSPEDKGFCTARMKDGRDKMLFRIRRGDNYAAIERLESITRKNVLVVREKLD